MEFERAAALRDRIKALTQVQQTQGINPQGVTEADVVALHLEHGQACVQVFFIRANQSLGQPRLLPQDRRRGRRRPRSWRPSSPSSTTTRTRPA
jgi:excinuclease ABC subunit C